MKGPFYIEESGWKSGRYNLYGPGDELMSSGDKTTIKLECSRLNNAYRLGFNDAAKGVKKVA